MNEGEQKGEELTVDGEHCRDAVVPTNKSVLGGVLRATVHDFQLVQLSRHHDAQLLAHLHLHAVSQPGGRHVKMRNLTLECGHLGFWDRHTTQGSCDAQG